MNDRITQFKGSGLISSIQFMWNSMVHNGALRVKILQGRFWIRNKFKSTLEGKLIFTWPIEQINRHLSLSP